MNLFFCVASQPQSPFDGSQLRSGWISHRRKEAEPQAGKHWKLEAAEQSSSPEVDGLMARLARGGGKWLQQTAASTKVKSSRAVERDGNTLEWLFAVLAGRVNSLSCTQLHCPELPLPSRYYGRRACADEAGIEFQLIGATLEPAE